MFIIDLTYIAPLTELDEHLTRHVEFLDKYYALGVFVASGRKVPRTGGIILALADDRQTIEQIIAEDPFWKHGLAKYTVTEFITSKYHPELKPLLEH